MPEGPLDTDMAQEVIAAAAVIASQRPGGGDVDLDSGPREPVPTLPSDLRPKAVAALDRVLAHADTEVDRWFDRARGERWLSGVEQIRLVLDAEPPPGPAPAAEPRRQRRVFAGQRLVQERLGVEDAWDLPARHPKASLARGLAELLERQAGEVDTIDRELRTAASRAGETLGQVAEGNHSNVQTDGVLRFTGTELETLGARFALASRDLQDLVNRYEHAVADGTDQAVAQRSAAARTRTTSGAAAEAGPPPAATAPTASTRQASVARALDALAPSGAVRVLLSVRLAERSAEGLKALRITAANPVVGLHPADVAEHHRDLERHGLLRTTPAGLEATAATKELWPVFLAASGWAAMHRQWFLGEEPIEVAVEEVLRISAQPLTVPVLDRLRTGPATEDDLARPMTAAARAQLPDQLSALVQQELLERLPDGALRATTAGSQLAEVHDTFADWYGRHLAPAVHPGRSQPQRRAGALVGPARAAGEEHAPVWPPATGPTTGSPSHRR
ncbi:hypothetical protein GCM10010519_04510 [Streptomyces lactacystinicus]